MGEVFDEEGSGGVRGEGEGRGGVGRLFIGRGRKNEERRKKEEQWRCLERSEGFRFPRDIGTGEGARCGDPTYDGRSDEKRTYVVPPKSQQ